MLYDRFDARPGPVGSELRWSDLEDDEGDPKRTQNWWVLTKSLGGRKWSTAAWSTKKSSG